MTSSREKRAPAAMTVSREQVIAFRLERLGLQRRTRDLRVAVGPVGLTDFPPGAALAALAPRLAQPAPATLDDGFEQRTVVRVRAMRGAPVVVAAQDLDLFTAGVLPHDEPAMRRFIAPAMKSVAEARISALDAVEKVTSEAIRALGDAPLDRDALHAELRRRLPVGLLPHCRTCDSQHVHPSLVYAVALRAPLVLFPQEKGPYLVALADRWLRRRPKRAAPKDAPTELVRRFLSAYGPASVKELAAWAGLGGGQPEAMWKTLEGELAPVAAKRWILAADASTLAAADAGQVVRLLSPGDPLLQLRDRDALVADRRLQQVIWKNLAPTGIVLAGTELVAVARIQKKGRTLQVNLDPVAKMTPKLRASVEAEAAPLAKIRGCTDLSLTWT